MEERRRPDEEIIIISTKLDILIEDFQEGKSTTNKLLASFQKHTIEADTKIATINNTLTWHSIVGAFIITAALSFGPFLYLYIKELEGDIIGLQSNGEYYYNNRDITIEMIEAYKRGELLRANNRRKNK